MLGRVSCVPLWECKLDRFSAFWLRSSENVNVRPQPFYPGSSSSVTTQGWRPLRAQRCGWMDFILFHTVLPCCQMSTWGYVSIPVLWCAKHFSRVWLCAILWTAGFQAPLSVGFSRQEYWTGLLCPPSGDLSNPRIEHAAPVPPALQVDSLPLSPQGSPNSCPMLSLTTLLTFHLLSWKKQNRPKCEEFMNEKEVILSVLQKRMK